MSNYMGTKWIISKNGQILRKVQSPKTEPQEIEIMNKSVTNSKIETVIKNPPEPLA